MVVKGMVLDGVQKAAAALPPEVVAMEMLGITIAAVAAAIHLTEV